MTVLISGLTALGTLDAYAISKTYVGPNNGNWEDGLNWNPAGVPDPNDDKILNSVIFLNINSDVVNGQTGSITIDNGLNLRINSGFSLTNQGPITMTDGDVDDIFVEGGLLFNDCTGTIELAGGGMIFVPLFGASGTFINHGAVTGGTASNNILINLNGLVQNSGTLQGGISNSGGTFETIASICIIGGELLPIDSTALVLAGLQSSAIWMLPVLAGAAGAGIAAFKFRRK